MTENQREDTTNQTNVEIAVSDKAMKMWTQVPAVVKKPESNEELAYTIKYLQVLVNKFENKFGEDNLEEESPGTWQKVNELLLNTQRKLKAMQQRAVATFEQKEKEKEAGIPDRGEIDWVRFKPKMVEGDMVSAPYVCVENYEVLLNYLGVTIRYNEMTKEEEFFTPHMIIDFGDDTRENAVPTWIANEGVHLDFPMARELHKTFITLVANRDTYHPIRDWIESKPWDGKSRVGEFCDTVTLRTPHSMKELLLTTWACSAVGALYVLGGIKSQGFITYTGTQGIGKTSWVLSLVPDELKGAIGEGLILNPEKPDSVAEAVSYWIVELGELGSTFRKSDIDALKSFITKNRDIYRPPYAARANKYARRTVFFATVDSMEFLQDIAGNRRFWTLDVKALNFKHKMDVQQFWAEIKKYYDEGMLTYLLPDEMAKLEKYNASFLAADPVTQTLESGIIIPDENDLNLNMENLNATEILKRLGLNANKKDINAAAVWLRKQGLEPDSRKRFKVRFTENEHNGMGKSGLLDK